MIKPTPFKSARNKQAVGVMYSKAMQSVLPYCATGSGFKEKVSPSTDLRGQQELA